MQSLLPEAISNVSDNIFFCHLDLVVEWSTLSGSTWIYKVDFLLNIDVGFMQTFFMLHLSSCWLCAHSIFSLRPALVRPLISGSVLALNAESYTFSAGRIMDFSNGDIVVD